MCRNACRRAQSVLLADLLRLHRLVDVTDETETCTGRKRSANEAQLDRQVYGASDSAQAPLVRKPMNDYGLATRLATNHQVYGASVESLREKAEAGDINSMYLLGDVESLKEKAEAGDINSMHLLGDLFRLEAKDVTKAFEWYRKAADLGHPGSAVNTGVLLLPTLPGVGMAYIQAAAIRGSEAGCYEIAKAYASGLNGYYESKTEAKRWYQKMNSCMWSDADEYRRTRKKAFLEGCN